MAGRRGARAIGLAARPPARFISLPSPKSTKNHPHDSELTVFALGSGAAVFLLTTLLIYAVLTIVCGAFIHSVPWLGLVALGLTAGIFVRSMKGRQNERELGLDPMGFWILKDIC